MGKNPTLPADRRSRRAARILGLSAGLLVLGSTTVAGQTATGAFTGVVADREGSTLSAVEVVATNVATGFAYGTSTAATGRYWLTGLPPGRYDVVASRLGLETTRYEGVTLPVGKTLTLDFDVAIAAVQIEGVSVVAAERVVAATEADVAFAVDREMIEDLPEESRSFMDLAALAPGATVGASTFLTSSFGTAVSVGALNAHSMGVLVDGGDFTEPSFGDVSGGIPLLAVQEFEVIQTAFSAELGRAASGILNAVTRRGSNETEVEAFGLFRDRRMNSLGHFETTKPDFRRSHWGFAVGGPITRDRTHYFVAMERKVENNFVTIDTQSPIPGVNGTFKKPFTDNLMFARLDHRISDAHELTLRYSGEIGSKDALIGETLEGLRLGPETGTVVSTDMHSALLTHRWALGNGLLNQARIHVIRRAFDDKPKTDAGPMLCYPSICTGRFAESKEESYTRVELMEDVSFVATGGSGTHRLKFGTQLSWQDISNATSTFANGLFVFAADGDVTPIVASVSSGSYGAKHRNTQIAVFAQDEWNPTPALTLNIGLRYEIETNGTNQDYVSPLAGQLPFIPTTPRPIDKNNFAPRLGFAWDPGMDGRTVLRGGFGIFYDALPAHSLGGGLEGSSGDLVLGTIFGPTSFDVAQLIQDNPLFVGAVHWPNAAELRTPMTRQFSLGVQRELLRGLELRVDGLLVQGRNIPMERSLNTVDPLTGLRYPGYGPLYQMLTEGEADARLLMTQLDRRFESGWLSLSYTLGDRQNTSDSWNEFVEGPLDPDDTDFSGLKARAAWDERHRIVATGGRDFPVGLSLSGKLIYSSGRPYNAVDVNADLNMDGIYGDDRPPGEVRNGRDGPNFFRVDLGAGWDFDVAEGRRLGVRFNVYNVLSRTNFDPASVVTNVTFPTLGEPTLAFQKRLVEVGMTVR